MKCRFCKEDKPLNWADICHDCHTKLEVRSGDDSKWEKPLLFLGVIVFLSAVWLVIILLLSFIGSI